MRLEIGGKSQQEKITKQKEATSSGNHLPDTPKLLEGVPKIEPRRSFFHRRPETLEESLAQTPLVGNEDSNGSLLRLIADFREREATRIVELQDLGIPTKKINKLLKAADEKTRLE